MTDPQEPIADPTQERLVDTHRRRARYLQDRPPAEFSPHIRALVLYVIPAFALITTLVIFVGLSAGWWRIP